jgi:hypothetical protein
MQDADSDNDFSYDAADVGLSEGDFLLLEIEVEIAHWQILHDYVDIGLILKGFPNAG